MFYKLKKQRAAAFPTTGRECGCAQFGELIEIIYIYYENYGAITSITSIRFPKTISLNMNAHKLNTNLSLN
jgi:hypothetical protein